MGKTRVLALAFAAACAPAAALAQVPGVTGAIIDQHRTDRQAPPTARTPRLPNAAEGPAEIDAAAPAGVKLRDVTVQGSSLPPALILARAVASVSSHSPTRSGFVPSIPIDATVGAP